MTSLSRRDLLKWTAAGGAALALSALRARAAADRPRRVLFFTKSSGFEHDVIARHGKPLSYAETILVGLGKQHGLDVTASKDGRLFTAAGLAAFDGFVFYTTGDLTQPGKDKEPPMPAAGKQALLDAVAGGKGFVGIHSATDTFHSNGKTIDPYIAMLGGEFVAHGNQQEATSHVVDAAFPGAPAKDFAMKEEWYALTNLAADLHPILTQETTGMVGDMYHRPAYPSTWTRRHGKGRVFYTSMGHRADVWTDDTFVSLLMGGIGWAI